MHVAAILSRQDFILKLARAFMMFGAPSHRLEAQMQATARVLEVNCQMVYIPGVMLVSFGDPTTHTSETKVSRKCMLSLRGKADLLLRSVPQAGKRTRSRQASLGAYDFLERQCLAFFFSFSPFPRSA